jgi:uncharacterized protein (UPF0305 family)
MELIEILGEELYNQVKVKLGDKKLIVNDGNYIPKQKFDDINTENKMLKEKVTSFEKNSIEVEKIVGSNKELQEQFKQLQEKHKQELDLRDNEINNIVKKSAIKEMLMNEKAVHPDLLMSQIDLNNVNIVDGKVDFNLGDLKTKYSNMFPEQKIEPTKPNDAGFKPQPTKLKQQLIEKYNAAETAGDANLMMTLHSQIKSLQE